MRIGIDLGGTKIETIALDENGAELLRRRIPTPAGDYDGTVNAIAALVTEVERDLGATGTIGLGAPGAVSPATSLMKNCNSTCLNGRFLAEDLERAIGRPVRLANDANCFALSEATDGAGSGAGVVFGVILGTGVGGGIVIDGRIVAGACGIAGEWGHNPLPWPRDEERPGPACYCGRAGCIETFLSGPGLERDARGGSGRARPAPEIERAAEAGDAEALAALERYADRLARALASVINIIDPHVIVLGGGVSNIARLYESVPRLWSGHVFSDRVEASLVPARHGDSSGVRGAAWLWSSP